MRIGILSDIHGNLVALEAVLAELANEEIDKIVCLGDLATSGPQPSQVISRLRELHGSIVLGNMDAWLLSPRPRNVKDERGRRIADIQSWGAAQVGAEHLAYLRTLPHTAELCLGMPTGSADLACFHASPSSNEESISATTAEGDVDRLLCGCAASVIAVGHTHTQMLRRHRDITILNPGSVGAPKNPPWAEYAVAEWRNRTLRLELRRTLPDVDAAIQAARATDMPHVEWWIQERTGVTAGPGPQ